MYITEMVLASYETSLAMVCSEAVSICPVTTSNVIGQERAIAWVAIVFVGHHPVA